MKVSTKYFRRILWLKYLCLCAWWPIIMCLLAEDNILVCCPTYKYSTHPFRKPWSCYMSIIHYGWEIYVFEHINKNLKILPIKPIKNISLVALYNPIFIIWSNYIKKKNAQLQLIVIRPSTTRRDGCVTDSKRLIDVAFILTYAFFYSTFIFIKYFQASPTNQVAAHMFLIGWKNKTYIEDI